MTATPNLPTLPEPLTHYRGMQYYSAEMMQAYALAAYRAGREAGIAASQETTNQLREALQACQTVAIMRGDPFLCDCIDNTGRRYQSAHLAALLEKS